MSDSSQNLIGVIGVGLLGNALSHRLRQAGHSIIGYDVQAEHLECLIQIGGQAANSIAEVVEVAPVIFLSLPDSTISKTVCIEIARLAPSSSTVIDTTTGSPEDAIEISLMLAHSSIQYLDATVAGASSQVQQGEGVFMVGGDPMVFQQFSSLLENISNVVFHLGEVGMGARVKLIVNLVIGLNRAVLAESLALANATGIPMETALEVLKATPAYSSVMDLKGTKMIEQDFTPQARLRQHRKDVQLICQLATEHLQELPLSNLHAQLLDTAIEAGYGDLDNSAIYKVIRDNLSS